MSRQGGRTSQLIWEVCFNRLKQLCRNALKACSHGEPGVACLDIRKVVRAAEELAVFPQLDDGGYQCAWSAVGWDHVVGLASLYSLALRLSDAASTACASERTAYTALRVSLTSHLALLHGDSLSKRITDCQVRSVGIALGWSQSLLCYARLLSQVASEIQAEHQGPDAQTARKKSLESALLMLGEVCDALEFSLRPGVLCNGDEDHSLPAEWIANVGLLEHWARTLLLLLSHSEGGDTGVMDKVAKLQWRMVPLLNPQCSHRIRGVRAAHPSRAYLLSSPHPSLAYLLSSHIVQLTAVLDGGMTYGMPAAAVVSLLLIPYGQNVPGTSGGLLDTRVAQSVLSIWRTQLSEVLSSLRVSDEEPRLDAPSLRHAALHRLPELHQQLAELDASGGPTTLEECNTRRRYASRIEQLEAMLQSLAVPPFNVAATYDVSMRLATAVRAELMAADDPRTTAAARSALLSASAADPGADEVLLQALQPSHLALNAAGQQQQQQRPRLALNQAVWLGLEALRCAREAMWDVGWAPESETPPQKLQKLWSWWECVAEVVREAIRRGPGQDTHQWSWIELQDLLALRYLPVSSSHLAPSCDLAIALDCGYIRLLERMLRRSGTSQDALVAALSKEPHRVVGRRALALAPPSEAAALLSTLAKVSRRIGAEITESTNLLVGSAAACSRDQAWDFPSAMASITNGVCRINLVACFQKSGTMLGIAVSLMQNILESLVVAGEGWMHRAPASDAAPVAAGAGQEGGSDVAAAVDVGQAAMAVGGGDGNGGAAPIEAAADAIFTQLGSSWSHVSVRLLPDVCNLAVELAEFLNLDINAINVLAGVHSAFMESFLTWASMLQRLAAAEGQLARADVGESAQRHAEAAAAWERLLWDELRLPTLLGTALRIIELSLDKGGGTDGDLATSTLGATWLNTVSELLRLAPARLVASLTSMAETEGPEQARRVVIATLMRMNAPGGPSPRAGQPLQLALPRLQQALAGVLRAPELLAELERACAATSGTGAAGAAASAVAAAGSPREGLAWLAEVAPSPAEARGLVPVCGNPACTRMEGDSEAGQRLLGCGRCRGHVQYCCKECQSAHWKAGHKRECAGGAEEEMRQLPPRLAPRVGRA